MEIKTIITNEDVIEIVSRVVVRNDKRALRNPNIPTVTESAIAIAKLTKFN